MSRLRNFVKNGISKQTNKLFVISGPSGSGKTTLIKRLLSSKRLKNLVRPVSFTTREKRRNEIEGRDYHFLKREEFILKRRNKEILEWTEYLGNFYGTEKKTIDSLLRRKKDIILCLDTKGAFKIKKIYPKNSILIFVLPPSIRVLKERLINRSKERDFCLDKRLEKAKEEINLAKKYDYMIENKSIKIALERLKDIIIKEKNGLSTPRETLR